MHVKRTRGRSNQIHVHVVEWMDTLGGVQMLVVERVHVITMRGGRRSRRQSEESVCEKDERRSGRRK